MIALTSSKNILSYLRIQWLSHRAASGEKSAGPTGSNLSPYTDPWLLFSYQLSLSSWKKAEVGWKQNLWVQAALDAVAKTPLLFPSLMFFYPIQELPASLG